MPTLHWDEIEPAARNTFNIWTSRRDFEWAKKTWLLLADSSDLCRYETEKERHIVIGRFLALASMYRDWCSVAADESQEDEPGYWAEKLSVEPIYLGQLVADDELSDDPEEALWDAWRVVMRNERETVVRAVRKAYGDSVEDLFVPLWESVCPEPDDDEQAEEDYAQILNNPTDEKLAAYSWLRQGCPEVDRFGY